MRTRRDMSLQNMTVLKFKPCSGKSYFRVAEYEFSRLGEGKRKFRSQFREAKFELSRLGEGKRKFPSQCMQVSIGVLCFVIFQEISHPIPEGVLVEYIWDFKSQVFDISKHKNLVHSGRTQTWESNFVMEDT
jgi:hypothetical protein